MIRTFRALHDVDPGVSDRRGFNRAGLDSVRSLVSEARQPIWSMIEAIPIPHNVASAEKHCLRRKALAYRAAAAGAARRSDGDMGNDSRRSNASQRACPSSPATRSM
jgi:hypothetical protein